MQSEYLIDSLIEQTKQILIHGEKLKTYDWQKLTWKENENQWSILECIEHLNLYGEYYLPVIENKIKGSATNAEAELKSGILGYYFAKSMLPKEKLNKMKTFKDKNPINAKLDESVIDKFINQQIKLVALLDQSRKLSLNKVKIQTSISSLISLKLGDTFQFFINHIIRHLSQIDKIQLAMKKANQLE
jgi:hypothetical protein